MKKTVSFILALFMMFSLAACGEKQPSAADKPDTGVIISPAQGEPAGAVLNAFTEAVNAGGFSSMEELGGKMNELGTLPVELAVMTVEPGYLNGFSAEIKDFEDGAMLAPWIGSIPYICYLFKLDSSVNAVDFTAMLKANADLRWNICTEADEMAYTVIGGIVCFVMAPASFE